MKQAISYRQLPRIDAHDIASVKRDASVRVVVRGRAAVYGRLCAMPSIPIDIAIGFTFLSLVVLASVGVIFIRHSQSLWSVMAVMVGWTILTAIMAYSGMLAQFTSPPPWIPLLVLTQLAFMLWVAWFSSWGALLAGIPQYLLVGLQCFRIPVEILLATMATRRLLAIEMTYYGRNFDMLEGLTAVVLAIWLKRRGEGPLQVVVLVWNLIGLSLITVVVVHGLLSIPYPSQLLHLSIPTFVIASFPVVWLLTVLVPIAYLLHFLSIRRCLATGVNPSKPGTFD
jgi:hypothetical protein